METVQKQIKKQVQKIKIENMIKHMLRELEQLNSKDAKVTGLYFNNLPMIRALENCLCVYRRKFAALEQDGFGLNTDQVYAIA